MTAVLQLNNVSFKTKQGKVILDNINLNVNQHDFLVIIGSNGAGKSTLLNVINRKYHHTNGDISLNQKSINQYTKNELLQELVSLNQFVSQSLFMDFTIAENAIVIEQKQSQQTSRRDLLKQVQTELSDINPKLGKALHTRVNRLSGGEQQLVAFILYLRHQPKLLLLDEHTSALDPKTSHKVMQMTHDIIAQRQLTCLMTTHNLDDALSYGNRLIAMKEGQIDYTADTAQKAALDKTKLMEYCY